MRYSLTILAIFLLQEILSDDTDYNVVHKDGSFEFGYNAPDSYHYADGNRNNVVRGEFGGRNPKTGAIDSTVYTAGPRGFRPRGKNVVRKYDLSQSGPKAVGSPDDPYFDPYEDPSYNFEFHTRGHSRQESANHLGNVNGKYSYLDDVGERHNVEYIAGKNTGFHVKTPYPDSNPRAYGPLYFNGRGKPLPRGRTSIQRGLDGSYRFVSAGPDQRRTETSDSTGHVRGSYTYLDDKGVQHSVHYIAGPETGYRVLKNVKGPHLPTVFPFGRPDIIPPDFYDYTGTDSDVFDTAASGRPVKPRPGLQGNGIEGESTTGRPDIPGDARPGGVRPGGDRPGGVKPGGARPGGARPGGAPKPSYDYEDEDSDSFGDLFGGGGSTTRRPPGTSTTARTESSREEGGVGAGSTTSKPGGPFGGTTEESASPEDYGAGFDSRLGQPSKPAGRPIGGRPGGRPSGGGARPTYDEEGDAYSNEVGAGLFGSETGRPSYGGGKPGAGAGAKPPYGDADGGGYGAGGGERRPSYGSGGDAGVGVSSINVGGKPCPRCQGAIVTNVGDRLFSVPPGVSVRAHVQSIDLLPVDPDVPSPSEQLRKESRAETTEQLNAPPDAAAAVAVAGRGGSGEEGGAATPPPAPPETTTGSTTTAT